MNEPQGLHARSARLFSIHYGHAKVTYEELLARAGQLPQRPTGGTAAAVALEETKSTMLSKEINELRPMCSSHAEAESGAKASEGYRQHIDDMVEARRVANRARVKFDSMKAWVELARSKVASDRALINLR